VIHANTEGYSGDVNILGFLDKKFFV